MEQLRVHLVVDRAYRAPERRLPASDPVWIIDTPANKASIAQMRSDRADRDHLSGVTSFQDCPDHSVEELAASVLSAIDLHHGEYSSGVPVNTLHVVGARSSPSLLAAAAQLGFTELLGQECDFELRRPDYTEPAA